MMEIGVGGPEGGKGSWKQVRGRGGAWFSDHLRKLIGEGNDTAFWNDIWVGERPLKSSFPRLYHLCRHKERKISEKGRWVEGVWVWEKDSL